MKCVPSTLAVVLALAAPALAQTSQPAPPAFDMTKMIKAPGYIHLEKAKLGYRVEVQFKMPSMSYRYWTAVVGETKTHWLVESTQSTAPMASSLAQAKGLIVGMMVDKKSGKVTSAVMGKANEEPKPIQVMPPPANMAGGKKPKPVRQEDYTLPSGKTVKADVYETKVGGGTYTSIVGAKGSPLEGVLFSSKGPHVSGTYTLKEDPSEASQTLEEKGADGKPKTLKVTKMVYDNGNTHFMSKDGPIKCLAGGLFGMKTKSMTMMVVKAGTDAKAKMIW